MGRLSQAYYFFTPYTDAREQAVARFFRRLTERSNRRRTRARLRGLLQRDIAVVNLWSEYRYKGYAYLTKSERRRLYANLDLIATDFDRFYTSHKPAGQDNPGNPNGSEQLVLLRLLSRYFAPQRGLYRYRESSSFGRLLRDPAEDKLTGDCNQIVTLYIYLYSRYFDIGGLRISQLPGHVALHYDGIDIETTNGSFTDYSRHKGAELLPVEEIASINLLDTTDAYLKTHEVPPEDFLQAARFALILSGRQDITGHNLNAAYGRLVNTLMDRVDYSKALKLAAYSRDKQLLGVVGNNGAIHELEAGNFGAARRFARYAPKRDALTKNAWQAEASQRYDQGRYHDAIKAFKRAGDQAAVRLCYERLFFEEQAMLGSNLTSETIKSHSSTIRHMRAYAKQSGNKKLIKYADKLAGYL